MLTFRVPAATLSIGVGDFVGRVLRGYRFFGGLQIFLQGMRHLEATMYAE